MSRLARIFLIILGVMLVLAIVLSAGAYYTTRKAFPETAGTITLTGLEEEVHVYRDEFGIPHIFAKNDHDLFFTQGYVAAQDRFWQMELWRHISQGRLSEIAGEATIDSDKFIRTMGWNRMAQTTVDYYANEAPEFMAVLEAYSAGVNAYIDENRDNLSLHFEILGLVNDPWEIEPWEPAHTVGWGVVMADNLSGNWEEEIARAQLIENLGEATVELIWPGYPYDKRPVIAPTEMLVEEQSQEELGDDDQESSFNWTDINTNLIGQVPGPSLGLGRGPFLGSNNWVISGEHTDTGLPLLANDPHLGVQLPSIWYEIGLHAPGWDVVGFSFSAVPGIIIGHNDKIAWGVTNVGPDVQDLYIEKINPSNAGQYEYEEEWVDIEIIEEVIKINGGEDVLLEVRQTQHGPIISDIQEDVNDVLAFRWTQQETSRILQSVILLNQAQDFADFQEALEYWDVPSQNIVYADIEGNIGYQMPSLIPVRKDGNGEVPVPGWTDRYEWEEWIPFEELPTLYNPVQGYIVTANHAVVDEDYPHFLSAGWSSGDRGQRITNMIEKKIAGGDKISADDIAQMQIDSRSMPAETYIPLLAGLSSDDSQVQAALERLRGWDMQERQDSVPASLFEIFFMHLINNVMADDIGEENLEKIPGSVKIIFMHSLAGQPNARWWDDIETAAKETREDMLLQSLADAIHWLEEHKGGDMNEWQWGDLHTITFADALLGASGVAPIEAIFNRGPFPLDGGRDLVNAQSWDNEAPALVDWHPSMRMIVDLSDLDASRSVIPTGNSGHPFNDHYEDQMPLWLAGETHPMLFNRESVTEAAVEHLILQP
ncbi:MAG: penicillin acylase family protein [Candidatus Promineifilaceae bacterium]|nr:penicillin acylase family protein [Candidatus Promineifilaceae bacterium]